MPGVDPAVAAAGALDEGEEEEEDDGFDKRSHFLRSLRSNELYDEGDSYDDDLYPTEEEEAMSKRAPAAAAHFLRSMRLPQQRARAHFLRSLRSPGGHFLRSLRSEAGGGGSAHFLRPLKRAPQQQHFLRSLRSHFLRSLRSYDEGNKRSGAHFLRTL